MDKRVETYKWILRLLIIVCTSMTMYSDHVKEKMIDNNVLPSPIGETMLEKCRKRK